MAGALLTARSQEDSNAPAPAPSGLPARDSAVRLAGDSRSAAPASKKHVRFKQPYIFVNCELNRRPAHYALVDTAAPTMITLKTLRRALGKKDDEDLDLRDASDVKVTQWNEQPLRILGRYKIDFRLGTWLVKDLPVLVADCAPSGFVIGNDLLESGGKMVV